MILALAGNFLLIFIVAKRSEARKLTSFLFVNMAVADLMVALIVLPLTLAMPYISFKWPSGLGGEICCKIYYAILHVSITASILSLVLIALDRYLAVVFPLRRFPSFRRPKVLTCIVWLSSIVLMIPAGILWTTDYNYVRNRNECGPNFKKLFGDEQKGVTIFYTYIFFAAYLIPLLAISVIYCLVCRTLWLQKLPGEELLCEAAKKRRKLKKKIVRMLVIVTAAFAVCWLPANTYHLILASNFQLHRSLPMFIMHVLFWCGHANSAINPWLYMLLTPQFRKNLCGLMQGTRSKSTLVKRETYV